MVTRSRAREGRGISVVPETQFEPETETRPEQEIPEPQVTMTTCEEGLGAARPSTNETASQHITIPVRIPETTATFTSQEISSSPSTANTQVAPPHACYVVVTKQRKIAFAKGRCDWGGNWKVMEARVWAFDWLPIETGLSSRAVIDVDWWSIYHLSYVT